MKECIAVALPDLAALRALRACVPCRLHINVVWHGNLYTWSLHVHI